MKTHPSAPAYCPHLSRARRAFLGLTLEGLADRMELAGCAVSTASLSRWETGLAVPSRPAVAALARSLRCRVMDLTA